MLTKIFLVRHAQSEEDIRPNFRSHVMDRRISITEEGKHQVRVLASVLRRRVMRYRRIRIYVSPSARAVQTMALFAASFRKIDFEIKYDERIRGLNWGSVTEKTIRKVEEERYRVGVLYFQFPDGDNTPEYVRNIKMFVGEFLADGSIGGHPECAIIFTHGFALRIIAKTLLSISDEEFRYLKNPPNCSIADFSIRGERITLKDPLPKISFEI